MFVNLREGEKNPTKKLKKTKNNKYVRLSVLNPHLVLNPSATFSLTFIHPSIHHMSRKSKKGKYNQTGR
jgi:hypothetical protein